MTYLSRIRFNPHRAQARRLLGNPQAMHATVLGGLPTQPVRERVLWRLDADEPLRPQLLVLSESRPSWEHLVEQAGWPSSDNSDDPQVAVRDYRPFLKRLAIGQKYAFRLTANPTQSTKRPGALTEAQRHRAPDGKLSRSVRLGHRTVSSQVEWLTDRVERWGFSIPAASSSASVGEAVADLRVIGRARASFRRAGTPGAVVMQTVTYEGSLCITDPDVLRACMVRGIGPAKAYGCGLLTLAPLVEIKR